MFKIVLIGDDAVGKSQIMARVARKEFSLDYKATIGVDFQTWTLVTEHKIECSSLNTFAWFSKQKKNQKNLIKNPLFLDLVVSI